MKSMLRTALDVLASRLIVPLVMGIFLLVYIGIAFITEDALIALMELTRRNALLIFLLALLPISSIARIITATHVFLRRRRASVGEITDVDPGLFNESVELNDAGSFDEVSAALCALGYKTRHAGDYLAAWRGVSLFPAHLLLRIATCCIFVGIFTSFVTRTSYREPVVEGTPIPGPLRNGGVVERIRLEKSAGPILSKHLIMEVAPSGQRDARAAYGIYPPGVCQGSFVYPRYLGVALFVKLSVSDLQGGFEKHAILNLYPAGKEASVEIPGSAYRLVLSLAEPDDGSDPYVTGRMIFNVKLLKGSNIVFSGNIPGGGELAKDGYRIALPDFRRMVITDFIQDYGVYLVWLASILYFVAILYWLPIRLFFPRREILLVRRDARLLQAFSRAEGKELTHGGVFNNVLDLLDFTKAE